MNDVFVFNYSCINLATNEVSVSQKRISSQSALGAQVLLLMYLNKCNKDGNGVKYWCDSLQPEQVLSLTQS